MSVDHLLISHVDSLPYLREVRKSVAHITLVHRDWGSLQRLHPLFDTHLQILDSPFPPPVTYDAAVVGIPKGRDYARAVLLSVLEVAKPGGVVLAVGHNKGGVKTAFTDMQSIAPTHLLGNKNRYRLFRVQRPAALNIPAEWGNPQAFTPIIYHVSGQDYPLVTHTGVFSHRHLDDGTAFLLANLPPISPNQKILDAGCGTGIIGKVAQQTLAPRQVVFADVDLLAVECVRRSDPDAIAIPADLTTDALPDHSPFDVILCNPPFHQDHRTTTLFMQSFVAQAAQMLTADGQLIVVANSFLPYGELFGQHFAQVTRLADDGRFSLWLASRIKSSA